ncbi:type I-E CRISPR-associated protein Cas6/Cse3/CasE [Streptomyces sp. NBC_01483]|uniref:type I-E CRISPR-associated protein Cas6/Cse3/CasE n=1 Tax=Streptomyces sp. NBC_01483 TaxID=2903883 RepID=UPI003FCE2C31
MHAAVMGGLAVQPVAERVLWRLETNTAHRAEILVLTNSRPSWEHLVEQGGWLAWCRRRRTAHRRLHAAPPTHRPGQGVRLPADRQPGAVRAATRQT